MQGAKQSVLHPQNDLQPRYKVFCVHKNATVATNEATSRIALGPSPLSYHEIVDELDSERWPFDPYPRCTREQLMQVHTFWITVAPMSSGAAVPLSLSSDALRNLQAESTDRKCDERLKGEAALAENKRSETALRPRLCCVVGVVWVRLIGSGVKLVQERKNNSLQSHSSNCATTNVTRQNPLEGYLQVVLTHPSYRRKGLAKDLLQFCLAEKHAPASVFAASSAQTEPFQICQWHLHTLMAPSATKGRKSKARRGEAVSDAGEDGDKKEAERAAIVTATLAMYCKLGFKERRYLYGYYAGSQDAVELVKLC